MGKVSIPLAWLGWAGPAGGLGPGGRGGTGASLLLQTDPGGAWQPPGPLVPAIYWGDVRGQRLMQNRHGPERSSTPAPCSHGAVAQPLASLGLFHLLQTEGNNKFNFQGSGEDSGRLP